MNVLRSKSRFWMAMAVVALVVSASWTLSLLFAIDPLPPYYIVNDLDGANDEPGQKDLNRMGRFDDPTAPGYLDIFWNWDEGTTGGNTLDGCALFDSDGDSNIDFAICGQVGADNKLVSGSPKAYSCLDNDVFHCKSPVELSPLSGDLLAGTLASLDPAGDLITNTDPFGPRNASEFPYDVTLRIKVKKSFLSNAVLTNVCTYPSHTIDSSDYSDCVSNIGGGFLRIVKDTVGADGTFTFKVNPVAAGQLGDACPQGDPQTCRSYTITTVSGTGNVTIGADINAAESVTEILPSGWSLTSASCQVEGAQGTSGAYDANSHTISGISIESGKFTTCTFTNAEQPAKLTVTKLLPNDNGSTAVPSDFTLKVGNTTVTSGQETDIPAGDYIVSETGPSGYVATLGGDCAANGSIHMVPGGTYSCTITNDDIPPSLTLSKIVSNDNGGDASGTSWTLSATCTTPATCDSSVLSGPGGAASNSSFRAGTYSLAESEGPSGYTAGTWSCSGGTQNGSSLTLGIGQSATCTITNDDQQGTLIVQKVVVNDNGGTKIATDFSFQVNGGSAVAFLQDNDALHGKNTLSRNAGTYTITEPAVTGYSTTYNGCTNVVLGNGETKTCIITNDDQEPTLIVRKVVVNNNGGTSVATDFSFQVNGGSAVAFLQDTDSLHGKNTLHPNAGAYTITEPAIAGYTTTYDGCSNIALGNGETKTCTITNDDQQATLIVNKVVVNDNGGTQTVADFSFKVNNGSLASFQPGGNTLSLNAGTYTVTEPAVAGYTTTYEGCSDVALGIGETKTCTVTNNDESGTLIVKKVVVNDNGGTSVATNFSFQVNGGSAEAFLQDTDALHGKNTLDQNAGVYTITEPPAAGYTTTYNGCSNVVLGNGETKTCTITNDDQEPTLIVRKIVVNNNGGAKVATDFSFQVNGGSAVAFLQGADALHGENTLHPSAGTYTITEPAAAGYTTTYNGCSNVVLGNGETKTCTITNDDQQATLIVNKVVINDNGGSKTAANFSFQVNNGNPVQFLPEGNSLSVNAGTYTVTEPEVPGYIASYNGCSNIVLGNGQTKTCTITNDDQEATLIVRKIVVNNNGGTKIATDFGFQVNGGSAAGFLQDTDPLHGKNTLYPDAGIYTVTEPAVAGYTTTYEGCSDVSLGNAEVKTCTITNDDQQGTLIVKKVVVNDNGGTKVATDFSFQINDGNPVAFLQDGGNSFAGKNNVPVDAGMYSVTEPAVAGYATSYSGDCSSVNIGLGETKTCTITNDDIAPSLTLIKFVDNSTSNDGLKTASDFLLSATGTSISISGAGGVTSGPTFSAGTYTLSEGNVGGYSAGSWSCNGGVQFGNSITLGIGQEATCSILNTAMNVSPVISVDKTASPANLPQAGGTVTFTVKVTNNSGSNDPFTLTSLVDDVYGDLTVLVEPDVKDQQSTTCSVPQTIAPGSSYTCEFTGYFPAIPDNTTYSERDVVTASGIDDDNGGASSNGTASDDAIVTMSPPIAVTNSSLCWFDTTPDAEPRTFKRLFTQDAQNMPYYRLTATNPGQFFYNLSFSGEPGSTVHIKLELPWPFVTQGARPIHVYDSVGLKSASGAPEPGPTDFCFVPGNSTAAIDNYVVLAMDNAPSNVTQYGAIGVPGTGYPRTAIVEFDITMPDSGFAYVNQHLDDGLKGKIDVTGDGVWDTMIYAKDSLENGTYPSSTVNVGQVLVPEKFPHTFTVDWSFDGGATYDPLDGGSDAVYNDNEFKKNAGVAGRVTHSDGITPIPGQLVNLYAGSTASGTPVGAAITDVDGWYSIAYKHTGRESAYTVKVMSQPDQAPADPLTANPAITSLKGNGFAGVDFVFP